MTLRRLKNETELLYRVAEGDEKAFASIFYAYYNQVGEFVQILTHSLEDTEEIVQEIFEKLWVNRHVLTTVERFDSYLFIISRNQTLNHIRNKAKDQGRKEAYFSELDVFEEDTETTNYANQQELVDRAVQLLPPQQKKVFVLRLQGLKNPEISRRLNLSIESVKKYQYLAMKSIIGFVKSEVPA